MYRISRITLLVMAKLSSKDVDMGLDFLLMVQTYDRGTHHIDDKTDIVLLTEEPLPLTINL